MERKEAKDAKVAKGRDPRIEPYPELNRLSFEVIGAALEVHSTLGPGFLEHVYEASLCLELTDRGIPFSRQVVFPVLYKGQYVAESRLDLLVKEELVVELKAVESLRPLHHAQVLSYLRAGEFQLGLLINFNVTRLRDGIQRVVWTG